MIRSAAATLVALALLASGCEEDEHGGGEASRLRSGTAASARPCDAAARFRCFELAVPLDRRDPGGEALQLRVALAGAERAPRGVLLTLAGGPGQPGTASLGKFLEALGPVADDYTVVAYDQRGTGTGALRCPALQQAMGSSDLAPAPPQAVRDCARRIGRRASLFGTDDVVADMEALRRALGARGLTLDGISYGTYVAERYALAYPGRVTRLVLDSVVPHSGRDDMQQAAIRATARVLEDVCRPHRCPGNPVSDLAAVVRATGAGPRLLDALVLLSIADPSYRRIFDVPALLHSARHGDDAGLERMLAQVREWEQVPAAELSQGLHASALCGDWRFPWGDSSTPLAARGVALRRAVAELDPGDVLPFDRRTAAGNGITRQCLEWGPVPATPSVAEGARLPDVPTLLLSGGHDLSTPLEWARREAALAPGAKLVVVRQAGHSVQRRGGPRARQALRRFLSG